MVTVETRKGEDMYKKSWFSNPIIVINGKRIPSEEVKSVEMKFKKASEPILTIELNSSVQIGEFVTNSTDLPLQGPTKTGFSSEIFTSKEIPLETFTLSDYTLKTLEIGNLLRTNKVKFLPQSKEKNEKWLEELGLLNRISLDLETNFYLLAGPDSEKQAIGELKEKEARLIINEQYDVVDVASPPIGILDETAKKFKIRESFFVYSKADEIKEAKVN